MERLERKKINGRIYYYYSKWARVNGRCRRVWQKYLGKPEDIAKAVEGGGPAPLFAEVFQWGLPTALWKECCYAEVVKQIDTLCPKRAQGLTTGEYVEIASNLASDINKLQSLRKKLREIMNQSPLSNTKDFTLNIENIYHQVWKQWCESC